MSLASGTRLGPYQVMSPLGAGGMGEVYKANDTRLGRDVAIKVLPSHLSDNPELKARFEREAKAISQLTHPHICTLYDVGSENGIDFLVMELLEGRTLADRLEKGPLATEQLLKFGTEIADALDRAHRAGIIHRDLKPGNIMLTKSGVKLLDFGLAKVAAATESDPELSSLPTQAAPSQPLTARGTVMGTFQYMSPEQLEGKEADARTDIFALGCVLYEMATGRKAFTGTSQASLISAIMSKDPEPVSAVTPTAPPSFDRLVKSCVSKDPEDRWQSAHDLKNELAWIAQAGSQAGTPSVVVSRRRSRERIGWVAIVAMLGLAFGLLLWKSSSRQDAVQKLAFILPGGQRLIPASLYGIGFAISPDGTKIVYVSQSGPTPNLRLHFMDRDDSTAIPGTENAGGPFFSSDGRWIGFSDQTGLKKVALDGGSPVLLAPAVQIFGAVWATDGFIYFVPDASTGVFRVPETGGAARPVTRVRTSEGEIQHRWPDVVPGGKTILYTVGFGKEWDEAKIVAERLDTGEHKVMVNGGTSPRYLPGGYLLYARADSVYAVAFNPRTLAASGAPVEVARGVWTFLTGRALFDFSRTGILAFVPPDPGSILSWIDRGGRAETLNIEIPTFIPGGALSPDGARATVQIGNSVAVVDVTRRTLRKLTLTARAETPFWSADGTKIFFGLEKEKFYKPFSKAADDSGEEEPLFPAEDAEDPLDVARNGTSVLLWASTPEGDEELRIRTIGRPDPGAVLVKSRTLGADARFSRDGGWVAYTTFDSGRQEVYVRPTSGVDQKWQISTEGGASPIWSRSGKEIFYSNGARLMAVPIEEGATFSYGTPKMLFDNPEITAILDVALDGKRFLGLKDPKYGAESKIGITTGWFSEIERRVREARAP